MADPSSNEDGKKNTARMELDPDTLHEQDEYALDCPACGSVATFAQIIQEGRCSGYLGSHVTEVESENEHPQDPICTAKLSLELVWEE